jgi:predicted dehydrogenase
MASLNRKLRMGMVGGGRGAFIGGVHRMAAALDGKIDLVAGAFSSDPEKSRLSGQDLNLDPARVYARSATASTSCRSSRATTCTTPWPRPSLKPAST